MGQGVNYAVVGATALDSSFHEARGTVNEITNASLVVQLAWFEQSLPCFCHNVSGNQTCVYASTTITAIWVGAYYLRYIGIIIC